MRRILAALTATLALLGATAAAASAGTVYFDGTPGSGPAPSRLGPYPMTPLSSDARPENGFVTSLDSPLGSIRFGLPVQHFRSDSAWNGWPGPATDVYFTGMTQDSMTMTLPQDTGAIDFYGEPDAPGTYTMTALADGKVVGTVDATWPAGQKYFGFWVPLKQSIDAVTITAPSGAYGFAVGAIRISRSAEPGPFLATMSRSSGSTAGGDTVTIRGENFTDGTGVLFGRTPASSVTVVNGTTLRVVTPAHSAGACDVTIVNRLGSSPQTDGDAFTFVNGR